MLIGIIIGKITKSGRTELLREYFTPRKLAVHVNDTTGSRQ